MSDNVSSADRRAAPRVYSPPPAAESARWPFSPRIVLSWLLLAASFAAGAALSSWGMGALIQRQQSAPATITAPYLRSEGAKSTPREQVLGVASFMRLTEAQRKAASVGRQSIRKDSQNAVPAADWASIVECEAQGYCSAPLAGGAWDGLRALADFCGGILGLAAFAFCANQWRRKSARSAPAGEA